jgi:excisionase family DNA binding protein
MNEITEILEQFAGLVASKLATELQKNQSAAVSQRLLTVDQAAVYIGRTKEAVQYLIATNKLPVVRSDRRVFLDLHDLEEWILEHKASRNGGGDAAQN